METSLTGNQVEWLKRLLSTGRYDLLINSQIVTEITIAEKEWYRVAGSTSLYVFPRRYSVDLKIVFKATASTLSLEKAIMLESYPSLFYPQTNPESLRKTLSKLLPRADRKRRKKLPDRPKGFYPG